METNRQRALGRGFAMFAFAAWMMGTLLTLGCASLSQQGTMDTLEKDNTALLNSQESLQNRYNDLENASRQMTQEIAAGQQRAQILQERVTTLQNQLKDTADQLAAVTKERDSANSQVEALTQLLGTQSGVNIVSNVSLKPVLPQIGDVVVRADDKGVVYIELPGERLFDANGMKLTVEGQNLIRRVARIAAAQYAGHSIRLEGNASIYRKLSGYKSQMDQSTAQALMVYYLVTGENLISSEHLSVAGNGVTQPVVSSSTEESAKRNYRVDFVIQP